MMRAWPAMAADYYLHPLKGDDANPGTSAQQPWQTLDRASRALLQAGDRVLLAAGQSFHGQLHYEGLEGTREHPIVISTYPLNRNTGDGLALIDAKGWPAGVHLKNSRHVALMNLAVTADAGGPPTARPDTMRCGVLIEATQPGEFAGTTLSNLHVRDVYFEEPGFVRGPEEVRSANGTQHYGWGIRFMVTAPTARLRDITITDCQVEKVSHTGLKFTAPSNGIQNVTVERLRVLHPGGPGVQMSGMRGGRFTGLYVNGSGSTNDSRNWGRGSGLWTWGTSDVVIERSQFLNANGPADSAGVHIDYHCRNVVVQHNLSAGNAGGFCEILGNNHNCAYRYNVSVNDGHRVKGVNGAFQEGKVLWLSGYTGGNQPRRGPFNTYFYNNTIHVGSNQVAKFALAPTAQGVLIANNIFHIQGRSELVPGDQFRPDPTAGQALENVVFQNNLYLRADNWPPAISIRDAAPVLGDPAFLNSGGWRLEDYIPQNLDQVRNRGIAIPRIPQDAVGLVLGLAVEHDVLGNRILDEPDLGAIEVPPPLPASWPGMINQTNQARVIRDPFLNR